MSNYPITDPAEMDKLPNGPYVTVDGEVMCKSDEDDDGKCWGDERRTAWWSSRQLAKLSGGIAARLVPDHAIAERDRAVELLREVAPYLERHAQILHDKVCAFLEKNDEPNT